MLPTGNPGPAGDSPHRWSWEIRTVGSRIRSARQLLTVGSFCCLASMLMVAGCAPDKRTAESQPKPSTTDKEREQRLAEAELDKGRQEQIWEAESVTFQLERRFGFAFVKALKGGDTEFLNSVFLEDAAVEITSAEPVVYVQAGVTQTKIKSHGAEDMVASNVSEWVKQYLAWFREFSEISGTSLRVLHLNRRTPDEPTWDAEILISVKGLDQSGKHRHRKWLQHVTLDYFEDKPLDETANFKSWSVFSFLDSVSEQAVFREVTHDVQLDEIALPDNWELPVAETVQYRFQYAVEDFDLDGLLDVAVASVDGPPMLLKQYTSGVFRQVAFERGIQVATPLENFCCCWIDVDNDGDPDLIMGDRLYQNDRGFFKDISATAGLSIDPFCMGAVVADYDLDGDQDLYVLYQIDLNDAEAENSQWVDERNTGKANRLWRNDGSGQFTDVTAVSKAGGGGRHTHAAAWFHLDDDLFPDLYIANDFGLNVVLRNKGDGTFEDVTAESNAGGYSTSMGVAAGDLDNDGRNELYVANMFSKMGRRIIAYVSAEDYPPGIYEQIVGSCAGNELFTRTGSQDKFEEISDPAGINGVGWAFAPALADFDNDGLLDIYATTGFMSFDRTRPDG